MNIDGEIPALRTVTDRTLWLAVYYKVPTLVQCVFM